jgi:hypothetical protein
VRSGPAGEKVKNAGLERLVADRKIVITGGDDERFGLRQNWRRA